MFRTAAIGAAALALTTGFVAPAEATFVFTMEQVGTAVLVNGSGSINTTGVTLQNSIAFRQLDPLARSLRMVMLRGLPRLIILASRSRQAVSGHSLSDTMAFPVQTFASLGVTPGTYTWTWGTGANADSLTLQIGPATIPEPASLTLLAMGLAGLGMVLRTRRA
jgi:hypothetical protein